MDRDGRVGIDDPHEATARATDLNLDGTSDETDAALLERLLRRMEGERMSSLRVSGL